MSQKVAQWQKWNSPKDGSKIEYSASNQHNGHALEGYVLRKTSFNAQVGSLGQSFMRMDNGIPLQPFHLALISRKFDTIDNALAFARIEAKEHGFAPMEPNP